MHSADGRDCRLGERFREDSPVLLTATIHVAPGLVDSPVTASLQRERDYLDGLEFYTRQRGVGQLVFVENSGADLSRFRALATAAKVPVEVLSLECNSFSSEFGKGYGEALLIDRALRESKLLRAAPSFIKVTGRILVRNVSQLLENIDPNSCGHFDVRDHDLYARLRLPGTAHHADTRFFVVHRALFDAHFRHLHETHTAGRFSLEAEYLRAIRRAQADGWMIRDRFSIEPIYGGTAGHGKNYDALPERGKRAVRNFARRWLPTLKI